ncbi:CAP domain-containing protein, partial [Cutibacterium acnes]
TVPPTESNSSWKAVQDKILMYTNIEREKNGLAPWKYNATVEKYAVDKSTDMAVNNYFDHKSPTKGYFYDIWKKDGFKYSAGAENIYYTTGYKGKDADTLAKNIVDGWMNSSGHRANILNAQYTDLGVGVADQNGKLYATQLFYTK